LHLIITRLAKLVQVFYSYRLAWSFFRYGVLAGSEHRYVLTNELATVVDIGANRGQFSLAVRRWAPKARIIAFEPLVKPAEIFRRIFANDELVVLHEAALGPKDERTTMHVSASDDSSSLLPISPLQSEIFPGTEEVETTNVRVVPLDVFVRNSDLVAPAMLKLDVQGFELNALCGCETLLHFFDQIYCECSFVELYSGQALAADVIELLSKKGFKINGVYNPAFDNDGRAIQADFLFKRNSQG
jgi:FkbM family methyltransferase